VYYIPEASQIESIKIATTKELKKQEIQGIRQAIIIGTNTFESQRIPSLRGAENNAREIYDLLVKRGNFSVSPNHFLLGPDATGKNILNAIFLDKVLWMKIKKDI